MSAEWKVATEDWLPREREIILTAAMKHVASCLHEVTAPTPKGASFLEILAATEFDSVLQHHGLAIVPRRPTSEMREAWQSGWFRGFEDRYRAMLSATYER
jgi:hypothetical protein